MPKRSRAASLRIICTALLGPALAAAACQVLASNSQANPDSATTLAEPLPYEPGRGMRLGDGSVTVGGYLTAEASKLAGSGPQLRASHASAFVWWEPLDRLKLFVEVDNENIVVNTRMRSGPQSSRERETSLERAHATWTFSDALSLRAGKFLTPVGRWNLVHADPLVWTTNRPLLTASVFPRNVTGLMASGAQAAGGQVLSWSLYASNGAEWAPDPRQDLFARVRGARLSWPMADDWLVGASYASYEQRGSRGETRGLLGADVQWARNGWEFTAEWLQTTVDRPAPPGVPATPGSGPLDLRGQASDGGATELSRTDITAPPGLVPPFGQRNLPTRGVYVQGVMPLGSGLFAVLRIERFRDSLFPFTLRLRTVGLAWRPTPATSLKLEHQMAQGRPDLSFEGWTASVSVLF